VKSLLLDKLENNQDQILRFLDTTDGRQALECASVSLMRQKRHAQPPSIPILPPTPEAIPPQAMISYYLNHRTVDA
jgi:hypothetical protein